MIIVGSVSGKTEAKEIEFITKSFVVANRAKKLAAQLNQNA
jgi:hypothetical protein